MSNLGIGAMLPADEYYGRRIIRAEIIDNKLKLWLDNGRCIAIWDNSQSCCESRYMSTDDDVQSLVSHTLTRIETKVGPDITDGWGDHETCFVEVGTSVGFITLINHNEHNGYYGGFDLTITEEAP